MKQLPMANFGYVNLGVSSYKSSILQTSSILVSILQILNVYQPKQTLGFGQPTTIVPKKNPFKAIEYHCNIMGLLTNPEVQSLDPKFDIVDRFILSCLLQIVLVGRPKQR